MRPNDEIIMPKVTAILAEQILQLCEDDATFWPEDSAYRFQLDAFIAALKETLTDD